MGVNNKSTHNYIDEMNNNNRNNNINIFIIHAFINNKSDSRSTVLHDIVFFFFYCQHALLKLYGLVYVEKSFY